MVSSPKPPPKDPFSTTPMRPGKGIGESGDGSMFEADDEPTSEEASPSLLDLLKKVADGSLTPEEAEPQVRDACGGM